MKRDVKEKYFKLLSGFSWLSINKTMVILNTENQSASLLAIKRIGDRI